MIKVVASYLLIFSFMLSTGAFLKDGQEEIYKSLKISMEGFTEYLSGNEQITLEGIKENSAKYDIKDDTISIALTVTLLIVYTSSLLVFMILSFIYPCLFVFTTILFLRSKEKNFKTFETIFLDLLKNVWNNKFVIVTFLFFWRNKKNEKLEK